MIVEPDFPDHWKTQLLIQLTGDPAAPMLIIRLWAFCQQRRAWRFSDLSNEALAAVCRWKEEPEALRKALIAARFLDVYEEDTVTWLEVHDFAEVNSKMTSNWVNGPKGGRPKKKPTDNPTETKVEPSENPQPTGMVRYGTGRYGTDREGTDNSPLPPKRGKRKRGSIDGILPADQSPEVCTRMLMTGEIFKRRDSTRWNVDEFDAFVSAGLRDASDPDFLEDMELMVALYRAEIPREMEPQFPRRTSLLTLLRYWSGELDKARRWAALREKTINPGGTKSLSEQAAERAAFAPGAANSLSTSLA